MMILVSDRRKGMNVDGLKERYKVPKFSVFGLASSSHIFCIYLLIFALPHLSFKYKLLVFFYSPSPLI